MLRELKQLDIVAKFISCDGICARSLVGDDLLDDKVVCAETARDCARRREMYLKLPV